MRIVLPIFILVACAFFVQYTNPSIIGADGYLHGRMAMMVGEQGFLRSLPEASMSFLATKFSDKDFLYHVYLVPFTSLLGYINGTKAGAFFATSVLFASVAIVIFLSTKSWQFSWVSMLLLLSSQFLRDTAEARPLVFALTLTLWGIYALSKVSVRLLFIVSFLFGMMHLSAWVLPAVAIIAAVVGWMALRKANTKLVMASLLGYAASFLIHPNFPNNIFYTYLNGILVPWYAAKTGVLELGAEFFPLLTRDLVRFFPAGVLMVALIPFFWFVSPFRPKSNSVPWLAGLVGIGLLGLISRRNLTHGYPILVVFVSIFMSNWWDEAKREHSALKERALSVLIPVAILFVIVSAVVTVGNAKQALESDRIYSEHYIRVARAIETIISKGERIFHANWSDTQYFIGLAPEYSYLVTLDPIYMYEYDPNLYTLYRQISHGQHPDPVRAIRETFASRYIYIGKVFFSPFANQLKETEHVRILFEDDLGIVFQITE